MREDKLLLQFETAHGQFPDTAIAARALLDWVDLAQKTVAAIDPYQQLIIEIAGVREGSTRFPQLLKFLDTRAGNISKVWDEYPYLKSLVVGSAYVLVTSVAAAVASSVMQPQSITVRLSDEDRELLAPLQKQVADDPDVQKSSKRFYRTLESDPHITGVGVAPDWHSKPPIIVPRKEFAERGGLWDLQQEEAPTHIERDVWDVVLLKPALISRPQSWQFLRDGLKFSAQMADAQFLAALHDGRVPLNLQEGVVMRVEVEWQEVLNGQVWETLPRTRRIVRVLAPAPIPKTAGENNGSE